MGNNKTRKKGPKGPKGPKAQEQLRKKPGPFPDLWTFGVLLREEPDAFIEVNSVFYLLVSIHAPARGATVYHANRCSPGSQTAHSAKPFLNPSFPYRRIMAEP